MVIGILSSIFLSTPPDDDAFITFRYAQNILNGNGFVYNIGERVLGTTTPLFTILLSITGLSGFEIPDLSIALCSIFLVLSGIILYFLTSNDSNRLIGLASGLFILLNPWILQSFGNEMILHVFLHLGIIQFFLNKKFSLAWFFAALAVLNRGDGVIICGILFIFSIIKSKKIPWKGLTVLTLTLTPWILFSIIYFGSPLPSTLEAKIAQGNSGLFADFITYLKNYITIPQQNYPILYVFYFFSIIGLIALVKSHSGWKMLFIWTFSYITGYKLLGVSFALRYFIPLTAAIFIFAAKGIDYVSTFIAIRIQKFINNKFEITKIVHLSIFILILLFSELYVTYNTNKKQDFSSRGKIYTSVGTWLKENTEKESKIGLIEIGFIGYHSERYVIDFCGLVTPSIIQNVKAKDFSYGFFVEKPDYFVYNPEFDCWFKDILKTEWFINSYEVIASICDESFRWSPIYVYEKKENPRFDLVKMVDITQYKTDGICGRIHSKKTIGQSFISNEDNLCSIQILMATYKKTIHCNLEFFLFEQKENWKLIREEIFKKYAIEDNIWLSLPFQVVNKSKGVKYCFILRAPELPEDQAFTIWLTSDDNIYKNGSIYLNGKEENGDLCFRTFYQIANKN